MSKAKDPTRQPELPHDARPARKRSQAVKLSLMGSAGALLAGCGSEPQQDTIIFEDLQQCIDSGLFEQAECDIQYQKALALSSQEAPRYANRDLCEGDFGYQNCGNQGSYWSPFMSGFMMSMVARGVAEGIEEIAEAGAKYRYAKKCREQGLDCGYRGGLIRPLYRSADDYFSYRTGGNIRIGSVRDAGRIGRTSSSILTTVPSGRKPVLKSKGQYGAKAKTISRGGFGSKSAARGGWGS